MAAIAPRPVFIVAPLHDDNFAVEGVRDVVAAAGPVYTLLGRADRLRAVYPEGRHDFPDSARREAYTFLADALELSKTP
jgi:hypothetical protein